VSRVQGLAVLAILVLTALNARGLALMVALPVTKPAYTWGSLAVVASGLSVLRLVAAPRLTRQSCSRPAGETPSASSRARARASRLWRRP
jgi:hypothetical protein